ncbi:hypothetical protein Hte_012495 [Hypoxylon texense]
MGGAWETVVVILHSLGARDQQQIGYATGWQILFLLSPLWINAFVYMAFARMAWFFLPEQRIWGIKPASVAKYFVWADVVTFIIQAVGGIMASPGAGPNIIQISLDIYLAGMGLQQFFIVVFLVLMITFHRWVETRIIYRIEEFAGGITPSNPVPFQEEYSYALDCLPMMLSLSVLAVWHPGRFFIRSASEFPKKSRPERKRGKQEQKAVKKQAMLEKKSLKASEDPNMVARRREDEDINYHDYLGILDDIPWCSQLIEFVEQSQITKET